MGIEIDEKYGGAGSTFMTSNIVIEEIAKVDMACSVMVDIQNTLINTLFKTLGTEEQKEHYLPQLASEMVCKIIHMKDIRLAQIIRQSPDF